MKTTKIFDPVLLNKEQSRIDKELSAIYEDPTYDGIIDVNAYCKAPIKILWVLKEVNDEGGYNQRDALSKISLEKRKGWWQTLDPIIYVSYAILNNFITWNDQSYITDKPEMINVLKQIAFINIKKEAGGSVSDDKILSEAYKKYRNIILSQIKLSNPDVIIGGNTLHHLWSDLGIDNKLIKPIEGFDIGYVDTGDTIFINTYHPAYFMTKMSEKNRGEYFDAIVQTVKKWYFNEK